MRGIYVFDAYGTLFNLHAAAERHRERIGPEWQRFSQTWRTKHIEYTWHTTIVGRKKTFWELAERSLDYAAVTHALELTSETRAALLDAYRHMQAFPEVPEVLDGLRAKGAKLAVLSNGDPDMLADAMTAAGIDGKLDAVLSVADVGAFKPAQQVYSLATDRFACKPADISFQSSNRWDIAAAKAAGMHCVWINRTNAPDEYADLAPDRIVPDLRALLS
jgi:2-haloacid dehalogenase